MEDRRKELQNKIDYLWVKYLRTQTEADSKQAEANYYQKLHDIAEKELEYLERWGDIND